VAEDRFSSVVAQGRALQERFPELALVVVGGTAAALHSRHRYSLDVDAVTPRLRDCFAEVADALELWQGWRTNRRHPPVLILGERGGVELGLRQQRRAAPLETVTVDGLVIPSAAEMLRIKAYLLAERRSARDYVDVAALARHLGEAASLEALGLLNRCYPDPGAQTAATRFAEACEAEPVDLATVPLAAYKGLAPPFTDWAFVADGCRALGRRLLKLELGSDGLPAASDRSRACADQPHDSGT
jgi:hypothetical protein